MKIQVWFTVSGDINLLQQRSVGVKWDQVVRIAEEVQFERATVLRYAYISCRLESQLDVYL